MLEGLKELSEEFRQISGCQELGAVINPIPNGNGEPLDPELDKAFEAWIAYSTPLWKQAGRSEEWIAQNIIDEWAASQDDIVRRYLAGDFTPPPPPPPPPPPVHGITEWLKKYGAYIALCATGVALIGTILAMKKK